MTASLFLHQVIDASSRVVPGATLTFMQGFRKGDVFHDPERRTPARNPFPTDGAGRVRLYLNAGETYEVTVESPNGDRYQFVHVAKADGETVAETVEVVREVPVETIVERIVEVADPAQAARIADLEARLAEAEAALEAAHAAPAEVTEKVEINMEVFDDFIAAEAREGEDRAGTIARLQLELEVLINRSYSGQPMPDGDQTRMAELTTNLRLGG